MLVFGIAGANLAQAGQFAVTAINPATQTVAVGDSFSVNLTFQPGTYPTSGVTTPISFNSSLLQFTSASSTYAGAIFNTSLSASGLLDFSLNGVGFSNQTIATINFLAIGPGTSVIDINPQQYLNGYGWFGINGLAVDGSVTVTGTAPAVPDATSTLALLGGALLGFAAFRRRPQG